MKIFKIIDLTFSSVPQTQQRVGGCIEIVAKFLGHWFNLWNKPVVGNLRSSVFPDVILRTEFWRIWGK